MPAANTGKEVGRVSIRVLPNATKFREDVRQMLKRVEGSMAANIKVDADTRPAENAVAKLRDGIKRRSADLKVDAKTLAASAQIAKTARDRRVTLVLDVSKASIAKVATTLAALSGARLLGSTFGDIGRALSNLDKNLPKIALLATLIASLGAGAISSVGGLITLGGGIAKIAGLGAALPGILGGVVASFAVLFVALKNAPIYLEPLKQGFADLGTTINNEFWSRAQGPLIDFVNGVLPQLQAGLGATAAALGQLTQRAADSFAAAFTGDRLAGMFASLAQSIDIAGRGTDALAGSITTLGTFGASYLPRLAQWFVDIGNSFNAWLTAAAGDGRLNTWVENGIVALSQLADSIGSIASIFSGINEAAMAAGGGGLATFAAVLANVAGIINGPTFQAALTTIFEGANAGFSALGAALVPIGDAIAALAPTLSDVLTTAGEALGGFLTSIATALQEPAFAEGLGNFFDGIKTGLDAIGPALPAVASALGSLGTFAGELAAQIGPVLGEALSTVAPLFSDILEQVSPLIPLLGDALKDSIETLGPALSSIATDVFPQLVEAATAIIPLIPSLIDFFSQLLVAVAPVAGQLLEAFLPALVALIPAITSMLDALTPLLQYLPMMAVNIQLVAAIISSVLTIAFGIMQVIWTAFTALITGDWSNFAQKITDITTGIGESLATIWQGAVDGVVSIVNDLTGKLATAFSAVQKGVTDFFSGAGEWLADAGRSIVQGLIDGINGMIGFAKDAAKGVMDAISNFFPHSPALEGPFSGRGWTLYSGRATIEAFAQGMDQRTSAVRAASMRAMAAASFTGGAAAAVTTSSARAVDTLAQLTMPSQIALLDADGSILTHARVIASSAVDSYDREATQQLRGGVNRYA